MLDINLIFPFTLVQKLACNEQSQLGGWMSEQFNVPRDTQ